MKRTSSWLFLLTLLLSSIAVTSRAASTDWKTNPYGQVRLIASHDIAPVKGEITLGVHFKTIPGWHVYWKNSGDSGYPPKFTWTGSRGLGKTEVLWPSPRLYQLPGGLRAIGYEGEVVYPIRASVEAVNGKVHIAADVQYLTCGTAELCVPFHYTFVLDIPAAAVPQADTVAGALIEQYRDQVPLVDPKIEEIPFADESEIATLPSVARPMTPGTVPSNELIGKGRNDDKKNNPPLLWFLLFAFLGGFILNVMPCVLPVLSIKLLGFFQQDLEHHPMRIRSGALAGAAGIVASFLGLALVAIVAKRAGHAVGWGIQFQEPVFVAFLGLILFMFALNLWGVFEIGLPKVFGQFATSIEYQETLSAHFISGLFVTLLATPCSAPFLGTAMGFALAQAPEVIFLIFAFTGLGMAFPYFALAAFPASVEWLPKPGGWMVQVRYVMGGLLLLTLVWLEFVLSKQIQWAGLLRFNMVLLGMGLLSWLKESILIKHHGESTVSTKGIGIYLMLLFFFSLGIVHRYRLQKEGMEAFGTVSVGQIQWIPFNAALIPTLVERGNPVFVDVTADWCFTCKYNENFVLKDPRVAEAIQQRGIVMMRADWTNRDETIGNFMKGFNRYGIPFYVLYEKGKNPMLLSELLTVGQVLKAFEASH